MQLLSPQVLDLLQPVGVAMLTTEPWAAPRVSLRAASGRLPSYLPLADQREGNRGSQRMREAIPFFSCRLD